MKRAGVSVGRSVCVSGEEEEEEEEVVVVVEEGGGVGLIG